MKTNVYIDGFNLYYRAVRGTAYKWLDLAKVCTVLLPSHQVNRIRYFTAKALALPNDPDVPIRQQAYIRALETIPTLIVHWGQFRKRDKWRPLKTPIAGLPTYVEISDFEEKGSDVNLATYLLADGFSGEFEQAVVVSNDSDLALPIRVVRDQLLLPIGVVNPNRDSNKRAPAELTNAATFTRRLRKSTLSKCQLPATLTDQHGTITKPSSW